MNNTRSVLLAFSGGLDTSFCVVWLRSEGWVVHTVTVDTGGFAPGEMARIGQWATRLGAATHTAVDGRAELFDRYLRHLIAGNVLRGNLYPLSVSAERVCQARRVVETARSLGVTAVAHGSTSAGNDQVRFDVAFRALAPDLEVIAPVRALSPSRADERRFLAERGFDLPEKTESYSVNDGMWGSSVGGRETHDSWSALPDHAYPGGAIDPLRPARPVVLSFSRGVPAALDEVAQDPVSLVQALNALGREYGIGRGIHLGDTILGIKGRVGFDAPAAHLLIGAHRELEKLVLTSRQQTWKDTLGTLYGSLLHEGQFFDPLARDLEAFLESSQQRVTGDVRLTLRPRAFSVDGVRSPYSLMTPAAAYGEGSRLWTGEEAAGFSKITGVSQMLALRTGSGS
jgi:argininosuccinate synthase